MDSSQRVRAMLSFVKAADAGSFSAAGRLLGVSAAAVSKNVAGLEGALGVRLMNRTTRSLQLTQEGQAFLRQVRIALETLDAAVDAVVTRRQGPSGRVRLSTSAGFGHSHLMPKLPGLLARHPGLSVEVDFDDRVIDLVRDSYDLALRGGTLSDSALVSRPVCKLNLAIVAAPNYLAEHGVPKRPDELRQHRFVARRFLGGRVPPWGFRDRSGGTLMFDPSESAVLSLTAPEAVVQAACAGVGVAQVGVHLAWPQLRSGVLKVLLHNYHHPGGFEMALQYPHRALMAPRVRTTVDYLLDAFAQDELLHVPLKELGQFAA